jgi:thioredoxin reductase (NADPH)
MRDLDRCTSPLTSVGSPDGQPGQTTSKVSPLSTPSTPDPVAWPLLSASELAQVSAFGSERPTADGEVLFAAGEASDDLFVVLEGEAEVVRSDGAADEPVATFAPGGFIGELTLLTGQRRFLTARVTRAGRVLVVGSDELRRLMSALPALAERIFSAFVARRELLRSGAGAQAIRIIGSRYSPAAISLRSFAEHSRLAHTWIDADDIDALLASVGVRPQDTPVVITPNGMLRHATPASFAESIGLTYQPVPGFVFDLVVIGSGPAGLAAAVYGASEGLKTVCLDAVAVGGQAGASARIENYAGFPNGISGGDLTARAAVQAMRLGARLNAPCEVVASRTEGSFHVVVLKDGSEIPTRAIVIASGARYQRLPVQDLERFEGAGVYYAATDLEARVCAGAPVLVIGGGNSAGQAAIYLAQNDCGVAIAIRRDDLRHGMSEYLVERIEANPAIKVLTGVEVRALAGDEHLELVTLGDTANGQEQAMPCSGLFCFIGAQPATTWVAPELLLDEDGFILTGRDLSDGPAVSASTPLPFETSIPGVFAAGDVRRGSMKRVAAAVGEGSSAVRSVHERLATQV